MNDIINRRSGEHNVGSVIELLFIEKEKITAGLPVKQITLKDAIINLSDLTLGTGLAWYKAEFVPETSMWESTEETTAQGPLYKDKVTFKVAKHEHGRRKYFEDMEGHELAVFAKDFNGYGALFCYDTLDRERHGMRITKTKTTGEKRGSRNEYGFLFYMESFCQPWPAINDL